MRKAFSMIELVFVIAVIGILAGVAIPKLAATRDDAIISKARSTVGALRTAIATERQKRILRGEFSPITGEEAEQLLEYGMGSNWSRNGDTFTFDNHGQTCIFKIENNRLLRKDCSVQGMKDL